MQNRVFTEKFDNESYEFALREIEMQPSFDKESIASHAKSLPQELYRFEPFEFWGGKYELA